MKGDEPAEALGQCHPPKLCQTSTTHLLLLYHFLLGSRRCMNPSVEPEATTAPGAMMSWRRATWMPGTRTSWEKLEEARKERGGFIRVAITKEGMKGPGDRWDGRRRWFLQSFPNFAAGLMLLHSPCRFDWPMPARERPDRSRQAPLHTPSRSRQPPIPPSAQLPAVCPPLRSPFSRDKRLVCLSVSCFRSTGTVLLPSR